MLLGTFMKVSTAHVHPDSYEILDDMAESQTVDNIGHGWIIDIPFMKDFMETHDDDVPKEVKTMVRWCYFRGLDMLVLSSDYDEFENWPRFSH